MSAITQIRLWKDVGFTDGCIEVPSYANCLNLPTPNRIIAYDLIPSKDRFFNSVKVRTPYLDLIDYSYMEMTYEYNNSEDEQVVYCWIDDIVCSSDTENYSMTEINFHVDYWRTYLRRAEFGSAVVKRRLGSPIVTANVPPQPYNARYVLADMEHAVNLDYPQDPPLGTRLFWVIVNLVRNKTVGEQTVSYMETRTYPITNNNVMPAITYYNINRQVRYGSAISANETLASTIDEKWELDPESVVSIFLSPIAPFKYTGTGITDDPIAPADSVWGVCSEETTSTHPPITGALYFYYIGASGYTGATSVQMRYNSFVYRWSSDTVTYVVLDPEYNIIGTLPWGMEFNRVVYDVNVTSSSCTIQMRFIDTNRSTAVNNGVDSTANGMTVNYVCPTLDLTSNAWSSYVYSGQRQYEIDSRSFQTNYNLFSGLISSVTGAGSNYTSAKIAGNEKVSANAGKLSLLTMGLEIVGNIGQWALATAWGNNELQRLEDFKTANQTNTLQLAGNGAHMLYLGNGFKLVPMKMDEYSAGVREDDINLYGVHVAEPSTSAEVTELIQTGGPLQLAYAVVKGDIPPLAKQYIRQRLENGVRMI